jgi:hypothetical protein
MIQAWENWYQSCTGKAFPMETKKAVKKKKKDK